MKTLNIRNTYWMAATLLVSVSAFGRLASANEPTVIDLQADLNTPYILEGKENELILRIGLKSTARDHPHKMPLNIAVVIDRSGSMQGEKLEQAKQAALALVEQLGPQDRLSLVSYHTTVQVHLPSQPVRDKAKFRHCIQQIQTGSSTALYYGVEEGARQLSRYFSSERINRVILLSDGLANVGPSSPQDMAHLGHHLAHEAIAVTTIGLGDSYSEDVLSSLAEASDANYYYVQDVETLPDIFNRELDELFAVVAKDVVIDVHCPEGVVPLGFIGRKEKFSNGKTQVRFPQMSSNQERYMLLRCQVTPEAQEKIADVKLSFIDALNGEKPASFANTVKVTYTNDRDKIARSTNKQIEVDYQLALNSLELKRAIAAADAGNHVAAKNQLEGQKAALQEVYAAAPSTKKAEVAEEMEALDESIQNFEEGRMSKESRKKLQYRNYIHSNSKVR